MTISGSTFMNVVPAKNCGYMITAMATMAARNDSHGIKEILTFKDK